MIGIINDDQYSFAEVEAIFEKEYLFKTNYYKFQWMLNWICQQMDLKMTSYKMFWNILFLRMSYTIIIYQKI
ncbi:hypothetical protein [Spiroplasma clarkii]|uniref:hypothetical protein n=1 Tax=Spiroplasma clarkii TaxID=2139 RepID=UPI0011BAC228|nr:hypothetical protein [Spiroplasma clarkii]